MTTGSPNPSGDKTMKLYRITTSKPLTKTQLSLVAGVKSNSTVTQEHLYSDDPFDHHWLWAISGAQTVTANDVLLVRFHLADCYTHIQGLFAND